MDVSIPSQKAVPAAARISNISPAPEKKIGDRVRCRKKHKCEDSHHSTAALENEQVTHTCLAEQAGASGFWR